MPIAERGLLTLRPVLERGSAANEWGAVVSPYAETARSISSFVSERFPMAHEEDVSAASRFAGGCGCPACGRDALGDGPQYFVPPTSGTAGNGLPIFSWDQAAEQLTRHNRSWTFTDGGSVTVTYGFRSTAPGAMPDDTAGFSRFNAAQIAATEIALQLWSDVANITFQRVGTGTTGEAAFTNNAAMLFGNYSSGAEGASAFAYYPWPTQTGGTMVEGDVWVNISLASNQDLTFGEFGIHTLSHEIGHAIGLAHPADYDSLSGEPVEYPGSADYWQDSRAYTVMSYFGSAGVGHSLNAFSAGPQLHDIAAAQLLYGVNTTTRTGDTVYGFNSNTSRAHYTITSGTQSPVFAIWDAGGNDTLDLSGYATASEIDLRQEAFSSAGPGNGGVGVAVGNIAIARGAVIENAIGGSGADRIIGNSAANTLTGNNGNDYLEGGAGADRMYGGGGDDVIIWDSADGLVNVEGGSGTDLLVFTTGSAPTTFNLVARGFEAAEGRFTDTGNTQAWTTRTLYYDTQWRLDREVMDNDDGSDVVLDYDQLSAETWSLKWTRFDNLARVDLEVLTYDNGSRANLDYDQASANAWTTLWSQYDAADNLVAEANDYDDGSRITLAHDVVDAFDWAEDWVSYDALDRLDAQAIDYDNGTRITQDYDQNNAHSWATDWVSYDALDRVDVQVITYDDGTYAVQDFDQNDDHDWASQWWLYDADDNLIAFQGVNDDGSIFG